MYSVLATLKVSLLAMNTVQVCTLFKSELIFCSMSVANFPPQDILVSSANIEAFVDFKQFGKSLM